MWLKEQDSGESLQAQGGGSERTEAERPTGGKSWFRPMEDQFQSNVRQRSVFVWSYQEKCHVKLVD